MGITDDSRAVGLRIAQARRRAALTQRELAEALGVSARSVQKYEAGETEAWKQLHAIAEITQTSWEWLARGEDPAEKDLEDLRRVLVATAARVDRLESLLRSALQSRRDAH